MRADFTARSFAASDIDLVRKGLWKVVNEDGGTGGRARLKDVQVAGKTGTAQATDRGHKDTIAWFACFAPFDHPKYVVAVMVQGGEHGGSVAGPIATRILERTLAMDEGKFDMQVAWLAPAHKPNPFQMIKDVFIYDWPETSAARTKKAPTTRKMRMCKWRARAVRPMWNRKPTRKARWRRKLARPGRNQFRRSRRKPNFFERLFGVKPQRAPAPTPPPARRRF